MRVSAGSPTRACQRQVWFVGVLFARKANPSCSFVHLARELWQLVASLYAYPQDARSACVRKKSHGFEADLGRRALHRGQRLLNALDSFWRCFAQELQGNVKCLRLDPSHIRSQFTHLLREFVNALPNVIVNINSHKGSHREFRNPGIEQLRSGDQLSPQHVERLLRCP